MHPKTGDKGRINDIAIRYVAKLSGKGVSTVQRVKRLRQITFDVVDNKLTNVRFLGGCSGNTQGVSKLVEGMDIDEVIKRTDGILCGARPTSCPDQLARALKQYKAQQNS